MADLQDITKRTIDFLGALSMFVLTAPVTAAAAMGIRVSMGNPILFRQKRPGLDGIPFELLKFRTMRPARFGECGPKAEASRITRLGQFLRNTSIDELPTLGNVVKGDMSLVGPRPLLMRYLDRYTARQGRRHEVKPGITGWAQVNGRNAISWEEKLELDVWYVENRGLGLDFQILLRTMIGVLRREGISHPGHATMSEFMGTEQQNRGPGSPKTAL